MGFSIGKSLNEQVERASVDRIKLELKNKFQDQSFGVKELQILYSGESNLLLLYDSIDLKNIHINLVYALTELYQQNQLKIIAHAPANFCIKS